MVEQILKDTIAKFNKKADEDPKLAGEIAELHRVIEFEITDGEWYHFVLDHGHIGELYKGKADNPDIHVTCDSETVRQIASGELRPMKALALRKIKVKASLEDMLTLRKFF